MKTAEKKRKLTRAEMRVAIAKDVLRRLMRRNCVTFDGETGYLRFRSENPVFRGKNKIKPEDVDIASKGDALCSVCALGGMMLAKAKLFNHSVPFECGHSFFNASAGTRDVRANLRGVFTDRQMACIETAFEGKCRYSSHGFNTFYMSTKAIDEREAAERYARKRPDKTSRIRDICRNIIRNGGTFDPCDSR